MKTIIHHLASIMNLGVIMYQHKFNDTKYECLRSDYFQLYSCHILKDYDLSSWKEELSTNTIV